MRGPELASCLQRAEGRSLQRAAPDLDAGDGRGAVEERLPLEFREAGLPPVPRAAKSVPEGFVEPPERSPLDGHRAFRHLRKVPAALRQRLELFEGRDAPARLPAAVGAFLPGRVAERPLRVERPVDPVPAFASLVRNAADSLPVGPGNGHCDRSRIERLAEAASSTLSAQHARKGTKRQQETSCDRRMQFPLGTCRACFGKPPAAESQNSPRAKFIRLVTKNRLKEGASVDRETAT